MTDKCQAKGCKETKNIQFVCIWKNKPNTILDKEYYCPVHLRLRAHHLETIIYANKIRKDVLGWW